jgi:transcriptional regulator with XRE-family HTH domain
MPRNEVPLKRKTLAKAAPESVPDAAGDESALRTGRAFRLGERVRLLRTGRNLTLAEVAGRAGLARSTLSKIENDHTSPTFEVLQKLALGLGVAMDELLATAAPPSMGRWSLTRAGQGQVRDTGPYLSEFLCTNLTQKSVLPSKARVRARSLEDFQDWVRHEGDDFLLVLEGTIELHTELYEPVRMEVGDSAYFDARMGHLCISLSKDDALVLWVGTNLTKIAAP